nr:HupE/UreJ family protein [Halomonas sp. Ps84H-12]
MPAIQIRNSCLIGSVITARLLIITLLSLTSVTAWAYLGEDQARILNAGYRKYIRLGAIHMLTGYDHLLFLFGVMFFLTRFGEIIKFITASIVGHSVTLVLATLFGIIATYYMHWMLAVYRLTVQSSQLKREK